jgi:hypothetical protein
MDDVVAILLLGLHELFQCFGFAVLELRHVELFVSHLIDDLRQLTNLACGDFRFFG